MVFRKYDVTMTMSLEFSLRMATILENLTVKTNREIIGSCMLSNHWKILWLECNSAKSLAKVFLKLKNLISSIIKSNSNL